MDADGVDDPYRDGIVSEVRALMEEISSFSSSARPARRYGAVAVRNQNIEPSEYLNRFDSSLGSSKDFPVVSFISVGGTLQSFSLNASRRPS